jgi:LysR family transcriptional regulator, benzoate and cis,cis-muconate-responsive activator of ben and cat genes
LELRHIRYFIAVAEELSFSKAADLLHTAQPSLSQQIRRLEDEIGVELFDREKRQIELTTAGVAFLAEAREIIAQVDTAALHAREAGHGLRGELRVAFSFSAMMWTLPAAIRSYRRDHPNVRLRLRALALGEIIDALRRHEIDAAMFLAQPDLRRFDDVDARSIAALATGVIVPAGHPLAQRASFAVEDIGDAPLILYARAVGDLYDHVLAQCRARGFTPARIEEVDRVETILGLVAAGEGVSVVPEIYETLGFRDIVYRALSPALEPFAMIVAKGRSSHTDLASEFVEHCVAAAPPPSVT